MTIWEIWRKSKADSIALRRVEKAPDDPGQQCQTTGNLHRCLGKSCHHFKGKQPEFRPRTGSAPHDNP